MGFVNTPKLVALVDNTRSASQIDVAAFDAILVAGGQAPMMNFEQATDLHGKFVESSSQASRISAGGPPRGS